MDVVGRRDPIGLWVGCGRTGLRRSDADDPGCATERRTVVDLGAVTVCGGRHLGFPFRAVGGDYAAGPVHRPAADTAGKHTLHILWLVSGSDHPAAGHVENAKAAAVECAVAKDGIIPAPPVNREMDQGFHLSFVI